MATRCFTPFQLQTLRATRLDRCGVPVVGQKSVLVTEGVITVEVKGNIESGTDVVVKNARGVTRVNRRGKKKLSFFDLTMTMTDVDPDLYEMTTGNQLVTNAANGDAVGFRASEDADPGFIALEGWTLIDYPGGGGLCDAGAWGYVLFPLITNGVIGDYTLGENAMDCILNAQTSRGSAWGTGPYNVVPTGVAGAAGKLFQPIGTRDHFHMQTTSIAPPTAACGASALAAAA